MIGMASRDRFLLCTPRFYRVEYVINPWMEGNVGRTDAEEAMRLVAEAIGRRPPGLRARETKSRE